MEPSAPNPNAIKLPAVPETPPAGAAPAEKAAPSQPELAARPEAAINPAQTAPALPVMPPPAPFVAPIQPQPAANDVTATTNNANPRVADDGDLIEKEWVTKAKQIISQTREDPYRQNQQMTGLKADYLQKRYQKTLKTSG